MYCIIIAIQDIDCKTKQHVLFDDDDLHVQCQRPVRNGFVQGCLTLLIPGDPRYPLKLFMLIKKPALTFCEERRGLGIIFM